MLLSRYSLPLLGLALTSFAALEALPAHAQIAVTSESRSSSATEAFPFNDNDQFSSSTTDGIFSASETDNRGGQGGVSMATQLSNIATVPTLLSISGMGASSFDAQFFSGTGNPFHFQADSNLNVSFTLLQATPFALFGATADAGGGATSSVLLTDTDTSETLFSSTPNASFDGFGTLQPGTYSLVADTLSGGNYPSSSGSFNFSFTAGPVSPAVPEASTTVSFGLLLALGLGGVVIAAKKKKAAASA